MKKYRRWFSVTLILILLPLAGLAGFNYYIDPLWNFRHANACNYIQKSFDERQQKTNLVHAGHFDYDTLLLGSSRVTFINQYEFPGYHVFNYSVSNMTLEEYDPYIEFAKKQRGQDFDTILLGLDFFTTSRNIEKTFHEPSYYINNTEEFGYRYKTLLSLDVLEYAKTNYAWSKAGVAINFAYDRCNVKTLMRSNEAEQEKRFVSTLQKYRKDLYSNYEYENVREILQTIREHNPNSRIIVFTTPVAEPLYQAMVEAGLLPYYEQWLRDIVAVYGSVYHFMDLNTITLDRSNFYDPSHLYPDICTLEAHRLIDCPDPDVPKDFGKKLNADNLEEYLRNGRS